MKRSLFLFFLSALICAAAIPGNILAEQAIAYYGRLTMSSDISINRKVPLQIEFRLYRNAEPGETTALWGRRISVRLEDNDSFYTELKDSAGTETVRASYKSLADAVESVKGGDIYISLTPVGYTELLPRKALLGVHRSESAAVASSAERVEAPLLKGDIAVIGTLKTGGDVTVAKSFTSSGGKIIDTFDGKVSSATLGADGGKVVFSDKFDCWNNMRVFTSGSKHVCADGLFGWKYASTSGAFVIPHPIDTYVYSTGDLVYIQQFLQGYYSALWGD